MSGPYPPWFYDAIHKQTTNRAVEALQDLQKAIDLNDNRAVYRSKLLLDQDLAARSTSLGRIYRDLGFEQLALVEGWKSVNTNPADYSAHRLLADSYSALPRHEIARVSELLQSQLLQPLNITPVQPQLAQSNLFILEGAGPSALAFNEFNPLFTRNRLALQTSGIFGNNDTYGDEVVHSGLWNNFSYSVGQFHYETDGFRNNNDVRQDVVNGFFQGSLSPNLNVQAEVRHREFELGDLSLDARGLFDQNFRLKRTSNTVRTGVHYAAHRGSDLIFSYIHQEGDQDTVFAPNDSRSFSSYGNTAEAQYLFHADRFSAVGGIGYTATARKLPNEVFRVSHTNGYLYSYLKCPMNLTWTFGISFDSLKVDGIGDFDQPNPKFGLVWRATPSTTVRSAAFRTRKRDLLTNQTMEPTQVAGFNQFFDDLIATESRRYGIAVDHKFGMRLYGGLEFSARELLLNSSRKIDWDERTYRAYIDWAVTSRIAARLAYELEDFGRAAPFPVPETQTTHLAEAGLRFFDPSGVFSHVEAKYTLQLHKYPRGSSGKGVEDRVAASL